MRNFEVVVEFEAVEIEESAIEPIELNLNLQSGKCLALVEQR